MRKHITGLAVAIMIGTATVGASVAANTNGAQQAVAVIRDTTGQQIGTARFTEDANKMVHVNVHVKGISAGKHGIHIHAVPTCDATTTPPFSSAGGHFNPAGTQHGLDNPDGAHAGDLPNLEVNEAHVGHLNVTTDHMTLSPGTFSLLNPDGNPRTAVVIHANADDQVTNPTGNSGGRIACGVIKLVQ